MANENRLARKDLMFICKKMGVNKATFLQNRTIDGVTKKYIVLKINYYSTN